MLLETFIIETMTYYPVVLYIQLIDLLLKIWFLRKGKNGIRVEVLLGRRLVGNALTVFLPTLLLNIIGMNLILTFFINNLVCKSLDNWSTILKFVSLVMK